MQSDAKNYIDLIRTCSQNAEDLQRSKQLARRNDQHAVDLDTYISKNSRFKSVVYDRREIRTIADNLGLKADRVRAELRKLGYCLVENNNGRMVWKRDAACK